MHREGTPCGRHGRHRRHGQPGSGARGGLPGHGTGQRSRPPPGRRGPHARHGPRRDRRHDRRDRRPPDRRRPRWIRRLLLALLRLSARRDRHPAGVREALRHLRPQARPDRGDHPLPGGLRPVRRRLEHGRPHRLPRRPGPRRRRPPGHGADHRRGPVPAEGTPEDPGQALHGLGDFGGGGPRGRRAARRVRRLALDLPDQPARRCRRPLAGGPPPPRTRPPAPLGPPPRRLGRLPSRCSPRARSC